MLNFANATRCSLVFALITVVKIFVAAAVAVGDVTPFVDGDAVRTIAVSLWGSVPQIEDEHDHSATNDQVPLLEINHRYNDLIATRRRGNRISTVSSRNDATGIVTYLTPTFKISISSQRSCGETSLADDLEHLRTPTHETRGKPSVGTSWL